MTAREEAVAAQAAALAVREARIDGMRAELAAEMTAGSPCPVCGSLEHPDPVDSTSFPPVSREAEGGAVKLASDAALAADQAGSHVAAAEAVLSDLAQRLTRAGFAFPAGALDPGGAAPLHAETLSAAARAAHAEATDREAEADRLGDTAARLTAAQGELDELDEAITADKARLVELTQRRGAALAEAAAADARAARQQAELAVQLGPAEDLEAAIDAAEGLADALLKAAAVADQLADADLDVPLDPPAPVDEATAAAVAASRPMTRPTPPTARRTAGPGNWPRSSLNSTPRWRPSGRCGSGPSRSATSPTWPTAPAARTSTR